MSLKSKEQKIYEILKNRELYRNEKGIFTMCPQKLLIRLSGKGERTVQYALKNLEKQGYIHREWLADEHIMLYYFPKEDFADRHIHNRYKNAPHSTDCIEKIAPTPQSVTENCTHSTYDLEKNCTHSTDCIEKIAPPSTICSRKCPLNKLCSNYKISKKATFAAHGIVGNPSRKDVLCVTNRSCKQLLI